MECNHPSDSEKTRSSISQHGSQITLRFTCLAQVARPGCAVLMYLFERGTGNMATPRPGRLAINTRALAKLSDPQTLLTVLPAEGPCIKKHTSGAMAAIPIWPEHNSGKRRTRAPNQNTLLAFLCKACAKLTYWPGRPGSSPPFYECVRLWGYGLADSSVRFASGLKVQRWSAALAAPR